MTGVQTCALPISVTKGETISLELGFDELEIFKKDSIAASDSIQAAPLALGQVENTKKAPEAEKTKKKSPAAKPKPTQEAIDKWKAKVAAQKKLDAKKENTEKPKPTQEAIDKWKAKVAAQKALEKKNAANNSTVQTKNQQ